MKQFLKIVVFSIFTLFLFTNGNLSFETSKHALHIWFETLIPSLFLSVICIQVLYHLHLFEYFTYPFFFLKYLFHIDTHTLSLIFTSLFLGYPLSSHILHHKNLTFKQYERLFLCCHIASPGFILITISSLYNTAIAYQIWFSQILSLFLLLFLTRNTPIYLPDIKQKEIPFFVMFTDVFKQSGISLFMIGGYFMLFLCFKEMLFLIFPSTTHFFFHILLEFSSGTIFLSQSELSFLSQLIFLNIILSWGGFCIHFQQFSDTNISYLKFIRYRMLQISFSIFFILMMTCSK